MTDKDFRITGLDTAAYTVPTDEPEADGTLSWDSTTVVVVTVSIADGTTGLGVTYGHHCLTTFITSLLADQVIGRDVRDVPGAWEAMRAAIRNQGRPGLASMAIAAVDIALWDAKARCLGQPLHRLLGAVRDRVPVYGSGGFVTYSRDRLADQLGGWVERGIPQVKMKIGGAGEDVDRRRVTEAREAIGAEAELFVDANGAYDVTTAMRLGREFADSAGVGWYEEPVTSDDLSGLAALSAALPLDVSAGEYGYDIGYFAAMLRAGAVDVLQADVTRCAGITEWLRVATLADAAKIPFSAHCAPSWTVHAATVPANLRHIEYFHDHVRLERMLFDGVLEPEAGALRPTDAPGHGLHLMATDAQRYRVA